MSECKMFVGSKKDRALAFDGQAGISLRLEDWAVELATVGPSYHEAARQIEALPGYQAISHETIRQRLFVRSEQAVPVVLKEKKKARVLFVKVDGLHTKLQGTKQPSKENKIVIIHEGCEHDGN